MKFTDLQILEEQLPEFTNIADLQNKIIYAKQYNVKKYPRISRAAAIDFFGYYKVHYIVSIKDVEYYVSSNYNIYNVDTLRPCFTKFKLSDKIKQLFWFNNLNIDAFYVTTDLHFYQLWLQLSEKCGPRFNLVYLPNFIYVILCNAHVNKNIINWQQIQEYIFRDLDYSNVTYENPITRNVVNENVDFDTLDNRINEEALVDSPLLRENVREEAVTTNEVTAMFQEAINENFGMVQEEPYPTATGFDITPQTFQNITVPETGEILREAFDVNPPTLPTQAVGENTRGLAREYFPPIVVGQGLREQIMQQQTHENIVPLQPQTEVVEDDTPF